MTAHCLFEQSGTFKNEFKKLGIDAYDYDILNDYGETDYQIDLFNEIESAYRGGQSIFDNITPDDFVLAFFPCIRFEDQILLGFRGQLAQVKNWTDEKKLEYDMKLHEELHTNYSLISKMVIVCLRKHLKLIIENPYSVQHYLRNYWCLRPKIIDKDRRENGDYMKKPTQFWFINCDPMQNLVFEPIDYVEQRVHKTITKREAGVDRQVARSEIHPQYASRFIRQYLIEEGEINDTQNRQ